MTRSFIVTFVLHHPLESALRAAVLLMRKGGLERLSSLRVDYHLRLDLNFPLLAFLFYLILIFNFSILKIYSHESQKSFCSSIQGTS